MTTVLFKDQPISLANHLPKVGEPAPFFTLTKTDLADTTLNDYRGQKLVLNIFPSLDTPTCANSVRRFNQEANQVQDTTILCISADLPFAQKRFCGAEQLDRVIPASIFRHPAFGLDYGVRIQSGPLAGLLARTVIVMDNKGTIRYIELVPEITNEPDYASAMRTLHAL